MCMCITEIKTSYTRVRNQTAELARQYFYVDEYLDWINIFKKELVSITDKTNSLVEKVRHHFTEFNIQETMELLAHSTTILVLMDNLYEKLIESPFYLGLKATLGLYRDSIDDFQELCSDLQIWNIDIPRNPECMEAEHQLCEMLKG